MDFSHHGEPGLAVYGEKLRCESDFVCTCQLFHGFLLLKNRHRISCPGFPMPVILTFKSDAPQQTRLGCALAQNDLVIAQMLVLYLFAPDQAEQRLGRHDSELRIIDVDRGYCRYGVREELAVVEGSEL